MERRRASRRATVAALVVLAAGLMACGEKPEGDGKAPLGATPPASAAGAMEGAAARPEPVLTLESQAALEAGNAAYRRKDYASALKAYERAAKGSPEHAAPWMGIYMVARVRNDTSAMNAAQAELARRDMGPAMMPPAMTAPAGGATKPMAPPKG